VNRRCLLALLLPACSAPTADPPRAAAERALAFLFAQQDAAGGFHSAQYGVLRRGDSLTATVLLATAELPAELQRPHAAGLTRALQFLAGGAGSAAARGDAPIDYPCYTAAHRLHALALLRPPDWRAEADLLLLQLQRMQLYEPQGWNSGDPSYGGFGLGDREQSKPLGAEMLGLSTTTAVLEAARAAGMPQDAPLLQRARVFVERCQNFGDDGDGGFCFTPAPDFRASKAGTEPGADGRERYRSYGTATCDGIRALLACGVPVDAERLQAARTWLARHRDFARVPGFAAGEPARLEPGLRLYWLATLARTLAMLDLPGDWRAELWCQLAPRQRADGAFAGVADTMKEDDPLVATPLALLALAPLLR